MPKAGKRRKAAKKEKNEITIISAPQLIAPVQSADYLPRTKKLGPQSEEQFGFKFSSKKPVKYLTDQIDDLKGKIALVVKSLAQSVTDNAELDEITVGLAVSVEGDIGIASAGAEASIEMTF
jgi:Flp pilus assembly secretin CpaC